MIEKFKIKNAFSLAEVLLTIAVIAVIMSLLVRTILRADPDKDKVLFLKSYHAVEEIVRMSINDARKYDQNIYADNNPGSEEPHLDFSDEPLPTAQIEYMENGKLIKACADNADMPEGCSKTLNQKNAICYYIAEHINTIGTINCDSNESQNIKSSIGVCFWGLVDESGKGTYEIVVDPSCAGISKGYAIKIFKDGKVTVPKTSSLYENLNNGNQDDAYQWLKNPTTIK